MKKFFKMLLLVFFLSVIYIYILVIEKIPEKIVAFEGENISFQTIFGIQVKEKNGNAIETSSISDKRVSDEVGKSNLEVSLFNTIPLKEVNVDVIPKTKVIPLGNIARSKIVYKWSFSGTECLKLKEKIIKNISHMKIQE